jgi:hypothetical protein
LIEEVEWTIGAPESNLLVSAAMHPDLTKFPRILQLQVQINYLTFGPEWQHFHWAMLSS